MKQSLIFTVRFATSILLAGACVVGLWSAIARGPLSPNHFVVRNGSGLDLGEIHLRICRLDGQSALDRKISGLPAGSSTTIEHGLEDFEALIEFQIAGSLRKFTTGYIDLWTGEGWVLEIQADGSVKQGYDYPDFKLR